LPKNKCAISRCREKSGAGRRIGQSDWFPREIVERLRVPMYISQVVAHFKTKKLSAFALSLREKCAEGPLEKWCFNPYVAFIRRHIISAEGE
jgi:hypothetical protein